MLQLKAHVSAEQWQEINAFVKTNAYVKTDAYVKAGDQQDRNHYWAITLKAFVIWALVGFAVSFLLSILWADMYVSKASYWVFLLAGLLFVTSVVWSIVWSKCGGLTIWLRKCSGDFIWQLNAEGISLRREDSSAFFAWSQIIALVESADTWHFYLRRNLAVSIPKNANGHVQDIAHVAADYWQKHPDNAGLTLQTSLASGLTQKSFWADLSTNLLGGLQLAFFAKTTALSFKVRTSQWLALVVLDIFIVGFFDYCIAAPKPKFNLYGLTDYSANYLLLLLAVLAVTTIIAARYWLARLMIMLLAATFATTLLYLPLRSILIIQDGYSGAWLHWLVWGVYVAWLLLVVGRTIRLLFNYPLPTISLFTAIYSFFVLALASLLTQQSFFIENYDDNYAQYTQSKINVEATYYQQAHLLKKGLGDIKPERSGLTDLYFVGLAGTSYQDVFMTEVQAAQKIFDQHFDTAQRSLLLINNKKTVDALPLGNLPNLSATLDGLAKKMNKDEDILFLFFSSHGTAPDKNKKDYEISTDFYPLEPNNIEAKKLRAVLDASGIKNRVIVISACHSGGFIDALKDENSLIMTASRKDRSSFGCTNEAKYTYFGDAYFLQSLTAAAKAGNFSFSLAFDAAKQIVSKKEAKLEKDSPPSEPQLYEGTAIKAKLKSLEVRLEAAHS